MNEPLDHPNNCASRRFAATLSSVAELVKSGADTSAAWGDRVEIGEVASPPAVRRSRQGVGTDGRRSYPSLLSSLLPGTKVPRLPAHTVISRRRNSWICSLLSFNTEV